MVCLHIFVLFQIPVVYLAVTSATKLFSASLWIRHSSVEAVVGADEDARAAALAAAWPYEGQCCRCLGSGPPRSKLCGRRKMLWRGVADMGPTVGSPAWEDRVRVASPLQGQRLAPRTGPSLGRYCWGGGYTAPRSRRFGLASPARARRHLQGVTARCCAAASRRKSRQGTGALPSAATFPGPGANLGNVRKWNENQEKNEETGWKWKKCIICSASENARDAVRWELHSLQSLTPALSHFGPAVPNFSLWLLGETIDPFLPTLGCGVTGHTDVVAAQSGLDGVSGAVWDGKCSLYEVWKFAK